MTTTPRRRVAFLGFGDYPNMIIGVNSPAEEVAGLPLSNLLTEEPSEIGRLNTIDPRYAKFTGGGVSGDEWDTMALINVNASPVALWRVMSTAYSYIEEGPTSTLGATNTTGGVTNVDETVSDSDGNSNSDGNFIVPTDPTLPWSIRFKFTALGGGTVAVDGFGHAYIILRVAAVIANSIYPYPSINVYLWESGVQLSFLGKRAVTGADQVLIFPFNIDDLSDETIANMEIKVESKPFSFGGSTNYAKLDAINFVADTVGGSPTVSDWMGVPWANFEPNRTEPTKQLAYFFSTSNSSTVTVQIMDDQTNHFDSTFDDSSGIEVGYVTLRPDGYTQAGVFIAGNALWLENGLLGAPMPKVIIEGAQGNTVGGQTYAADMFRRLGISVNLLVTEDEGNILTRGVDWLRGHAGAFFAAFRANLDAQYQQWDSGWWTMTDAGELVQMTNLYTPGGDTLFTKQYTLEQKL